MASSAWLLLSVTFVAVLARNEIRGDQDVSDAIRSLQEQVNALLDHRQEDYNALEGSLKRAIEKNTELFVLKNEMKQLRKEVVSLRGGNGNEAKNERLRVRWLGSAVTELQGEVAEVLRARNASEELAERSSTRAELALLRGDVASVGRGIRNVGGRIAKIDAILGTIRLDIAAVKERFSLLSRTCADIASQLSSVQVEVKSLRCESSQGGTGNSVMQQEGGGSGGSGGSEKAGTGLPAGERSRIDRHRGSRRHGYARRAEDYRTRVEERLKNLEHRVALVAQKRVSVERHIAEREEQKWSSLSKRVKGLEKARVELSREISNVSETAATLTSSIEDSLGARLTGSLGGIENALETNASSMRRELARLGVDSARKAADLSLTREELNNLRRTVQALSVSASKLQEKSDRQQEAIDRLNGSGLPANLAQLFSPPDAFGNLQGLEDRYHLIRKNLASDCRPRTVGNESSADGLRLLEVGEGARPMLAFCRTGWTVVARRIDGTLDFDRSWADYSLGFGSPVSEYWIGNEILHKLTRDNCTKLRIDMVDIYGERWRAEYRSFAVESYESGYRLRVDGYTGNATDALSYQNGMPFSAKDRDMDSSATHCARNYHGGWWFSRCQHANLNGKYSLGLTWFRSDANHWMSIASSEMSIQRAENCHPR